MTRQVDRDELVPRHLAHRSQHGRVADATRLQLPIGPSRRVPRPDPRTWPIRRDHGVTLHPVGPARPVDRRTTHHAVRDCIPTMGMVRWSRCGPPSHAPEVIHAFPRRDRRHRAAPGSCVACRGRRWEPECRRQVRAGTDHGLLDAGEDRERDASRLREAALRQVRPKAKPGAEARHRRGHGRLVDRERDRREAVGPDLVHDGRLGLHLLRFRRRLGQ